MIVCLFAFHFLKKESKIFHVFFEFLLFLEFLEVHWGFLLFFALGIKLLLTFFIGLILIKHLHDFLLSAEFTDKFRHDKVLNINIALKLGLKKFDSFFFEVGLFLFRPDLFGEGFTFLQSGLAHVFVWIVLRNLVNI